MAKHTLCTSRLPGSCEPATAWLRLAAVFAMNSITTLTDSTFGLFSNQLVEKYGTSRANVGIAYSIYLTTGAGIGLLVTPFCATYGYRPVAIGGSLAITLGMTLAPFMPTLWGFHLFYGVIGGVGYGIITFVGPSVLQPIFHGNRDFAFAVSCLGYTVGTALPPLMAGYLLEQHTLEGAMLIQAGVVAQSVLFAMGLYVNDRDIQRMNEHASNASGEMLKTKTNSQDDAELQRPKCDKNTPSEKSTEQQLTIPGTSHGLSRNHAAKTPGQTTWRTFLEDLADYSVCRVPQYVLLVLYDLLFYAGRILMYALVPSAAIARGLTRSDAATVMFYVGISNCAARICTCCLINFQWFHPFWYTSMGVGCMVVSSFFAMYGHSYGMFAACTLLWGMSEGISNTCLGVLISKIVGPRNFKRAYVILWATMLPTTFATPPFSGWIVDITGKYDMAFLFGGLLNTSGLLVIVTIAIMRTKFRRAWERAVSRHLLTAASFERSALGTERKLLSRTDESPSPQIPVCGRSS